MLFESNPNDKLSELRWEIRPEERRERNLQGLRIIIELLPIFLGGLFLRFLSSNDYNFPYAFKAIYYTTLFIVAGIVIYCILSIYSPRNKERTYFLNGEGLKVSKGNKVKFYRWSDFDCYYIFSVIRADSINKKFKGNSTISKEDRDKIIETDRQWEKINGKTYYLKKKSGSILGKFIKTFIVVRAEPDNSEKVNDFLKNHLIQKEMNYTTDLGLVFYEFR